MLKLTIKVIHDLTRKPGLWLSACLACLLIATYVDGHWLAVTAAQELIVTASFGAKEPVAPDEPIELTLNRQLAADEGRIAALVGTADLTGLFTAQGLNMKYDPRLLPLPTGETEVTVYIVAPDGEWKEVARFPLLVAARSAAQPDAATAAPAAETPQATPEPARRIAGFDKFDVAPSLNVGVKSQFAEIHSPDSNRPARPQSVDATIQGRLTTDLKRGQLAMQSQFDVIGSSFRNEALRFAERGDRAPKVDLSSYSMQFQYGARRFISGQSTFGAHRHLINNFASRGLTLTLPLGGGADVSLVAMNSTSIVGWDNFFGLSNRRHRIFGGVFGLDVFKDRPGGLRFEAGALDAWFQPRTVVSQGRVDDTERSRGYSARVLARDRSDRFRLDAGFTRSQFTNPEDPLLNQGASVVPSRQVTRNARYADASFDLFKDFTFAKAGAATEGNSNQRIQDAASAPNGGAPKKFNLTLNLGHERVDPLFKSIGANTQADLNRNQVEMVGSFGELAFAAAYARFNDNLAGIPTILRTDTRRNSFVISTPLQGLFSGRPVAQPNPFLPRIGYTFQRVRAFADFTPVGGGFDEPGAIPDQANIVQSFVAEWQFKEMRLGYRLNHSSQNNRAVGRERADLRNLTHNATFGWAPLTTLDFLLEFNLEDANNRELAGDDRTLRFGLVTNWQATRRQSFKATFSTIGADSFLERARAGDSRNIEFDLQWNYRIARESENRFRKFQAVYFLRYSNRFARARNFAENFNTLTKLQTFNTGLNFIFF